MEEMNLWLQDIWYRTELLAVVSYIMQRTVLWSCRIWRVQKKQTAYRATDVKFFQKDYKEDASLTQEFH